MTKPWATYTRVSTDEQAEEGISLEVQAETCRMFLKARKLPIGPVIVDDGYSAGSTKRPGYLRLMELVRKAELGGVCVLKLNRVHRNQLEQLLMLRALEQVGAGFVSVTESFDLATPHGKLMVQQLSSFAEYFRNDKSDEVKRAMGYLKAQGYWVGAVPIGCALQHEGSRRRLIFDPVHGHAVAACWKLAAEGTPLADIARHLTITGVPTRSGKPWAKNAISYFLKSRSAVGLLVDEKTWKRAQAALGAKLYPGRIPSRLKLKPAQRSKDRVWRLHGLAFCASCGSALTGRFSTGNGGRCYYLRCSGRDSRGTSFCKARDLPATAYEDAVVERLVKMVTGDELQRLMAADLAKAQAQAGPLKVRVERLSKQRDDLKTKLGRTLDLVTEGGAVARAAGNRVAELQEQLEELVLELAEAQGILASARIDCDTMETILAEIRAGVDELPSQDWETQKRRIGLLVKEVHMGADTVGRIVLWPYGPGDGHGGDDSGPGGGPNGGGAPAMVRVRSRVDNHSLSSARTISVPFAVTEAIGFKGRRLVRLA